MLEEVENSYVLLYFIYSNRDMKIKFAWNMKIDIFLTYLYMFITAGRIGAFWGLRVVPAMRQGNRPHLAFSYVAGPPILSSL